MFRNSTMQRIIASALLATFASSTVAPLVAFAQTPAPFTLQPLGGATRSSLPAVDANGIPTGKGGQRHAATSASAATAAAPTQAYGFALSQLEAMAGKSDADLVAGRGADALAQVNALRAQYVRLKKEEAAMAQSFAATEAHLRAAGLASGEILARHQAAMQEFGARNAELKTAMAALDAAAGGRGNVQTALNDLARLMKQHSSLPGQGAYGKGHAWGKKKKAPPALAMTERQHEKRFPRSVLLAAAGSLSGIALPDAILPDAVQPGDLAEQGEVVLSPAVRALAAQLGNNPVAIYNWVRNNVAYAPGFGAMQNADATLLARRGSATDTASLLIALNRAAGIPARYVYGTIEVPLAKINNWLGVNNAAAAQALLSQAGIPNRAVSQAGQAGAIQLEHVWVEAFVDFSPSRGGVNKAPGAWVPLDASFKQMDNKPGLDLANAVSLNETGLLGQVRQGAVCTPDYAQNLNLQNLQAGYADYKARLNNYLGQQGADLTVGDVLGQRSIAARNYSILLGSLPYTKVAQGTIVNALPDNLRWQFRLQLFAGAAQQAANSPAVSYSGSLASLANKRLTLSFVPASQADADVLASYMPKPHADGSPIQASELPLEVPGYLVRVKAEIRADGEVVASGGSFVLGSELAGSIASFDPSSGDWNESSFGAHAGDYHAVAVDAQGVSAGQLAAVKARLNATQAKLAGGQGASLARDDVSGDLLYHAALGYFATVDANAGVFQRAARVVDVRQPSYGRAVAQAQPEMVMGIINKVRFPGVVLDIDRLDSAVAQNSGGLAPAAYIKQANERNAAYGHLVLAKLFTSAQTPGQAASPVKALNAAASAGSKVFAVTGANAASVLPQVDIAANAAADIQNTVAAGSRVLLAQGPVNIGNWNGHGLAMEDASGAGSYRLHGETGYATSALYLPNGTTWLALASPLQAAGAAAPAAQAAQPLNEALASLLGEAGSTTRWSFYAGQADVASGLFLARLAAGQGSSACDILAGTIAAGLDTSGGFDAGAVTGAPVITSAPVISGGANQLYNYAVLATDPKGAALVFTLRDAPTGMAISADGVISWAKPVAGTWNVTVRADNGRAYAEQRYQLTVGDQVPLDANLRITPQVINLGETVIIDVLGTGGSGNVARSLVIDGQDVPLTVEGRATVTGTAIGAHQVTARITDSIGTTTRVGTYSVRDPADSSTPVALIAAPGDDAEVTAPVNVTGTATATNLAYYQLLLRPAGGNAWSEIARGTSAVTNGVLGKLDPTQLANGIYELVLSVVDANGRQQTQMITLDVYRDLKIGQFSLKFEDLNIEAAGIPLRVMRIYDTRRKNESLDFGYGWSVDYQSVQMRKNMVLGLGWDVVAHPQDLTLCLVARGKRKINITLPDGKVERFEAANRNQCGFFQIPAVDIVFTALPGTTSRLEAINIPIVEARGGQLYDMDNFGPWDPADFKLTTEDNYAYYLRDGVGIVQVKDPNGNTLTYGKNGILHSSGQSVAFTRDAKGRIASITDPAGKSIRYSYGANGDLVNVTNRVEASSNYSYNRSHGLTDYTDPTGAVVSRYVYDDLGRLVAAYDAEGKAVEMIHNTALNQEQVKDRRGNVTTFQYDAAGNITQKIDALGNSTTYAYDAAGNETSVTDPLGNKTLRSIDPSSGKMLSEEDPLGNKQVWNYDEGSKTVLTDTIDANGNKTTYMYGISGTSLSRPLGYSVSFGNDNSGNITRVSIAGQSTMYEYDSKGNRVKETDAAGNVTTYTYDANNKQIGRSWQRVKPGETTGLAEKDSVKRDAESRIVEQIDALGLSSKTEYNAGNLITAMIDPAGRATRFAYSVRGKLSKTSFPDGSSASQSYDAENNLTAVVDRQGRTTSYEYDALNRPTRLTEADGSSYRIEYDAAGRVAATIDSAGNRTANSYDAAGRLVKITNAVGGAREFGYDANGNRTSVKEPDGRLTTYQYDALDRLVKTVAPNGETLSTVWNVTGTKQAEIDSAGNRFDFKYDALNRLVEVRQTDGAEALVTAYAFDSVGNKVSQTDAEGRTTRWEYDAGRRPVSRTLPNGLTERISYDAMGNATGLTAFDGTSHSTAFDAMNQVALQVRPDGVRIEKSYTPSGMVASVVVTGPASGGVETGTTRFAYDALDRIVRQTNPDGSFLAYAYDASGNLAERSTRTGGVRYTFDAIGRMESAIDSAGRKTSYAYDAAGRLASATQPDGTVTRRGYDEDGRLQQVVHVKSDGAVLAGVRYSFTTAGLRQTKDEFDVQSSLTGDVAVNPFRSSSYTYDNANRLTREVTRDRSGALVLSVDYAYDKVGNRTSKTQVQGNVTEITRYSYDQNDRLQESRKTAGAGEVVTKYGWDENGNLASKQVGNTYTRFGWNSANQLVSVSQGSGPQALQVIAQYTYDAQGNRSARTIPSMGGAPATVTRYTTDNSFLHGQTLEESTVSGTAQSSIQYFWGMELHYSEQASGLATLLADGQGTVQAQLRSGQVERAAGFDAYGVALGQQESGYGYTGEYFDGVVGLQFNRARWYDAEIGRFISADSYSGAAARPLTLNRYIYADDDPVNRIDRSGNMSLSEQGAVAEGQGALNSAAVPNVGRQFASRMAKKAGDAFTDKIENAIKDCLRPGVTMKSGKNVSKIKTNDGRWAMPDFMFQVGDKIAYLEAKTKLPGLKSIGDQFQRVGKQLQAAIDNNRAIGVITQTKHRDATLEKRKADILKTLSGDGGLVTFINGFHGLLSFVGEYVIEECVESAIGL